MFTHKREDPDKKAMALFNSKTGLKIRLADGEYEKSTWPELVDVKITDYCPFGCSFCYQGSTKDGKHGDLNYLREVFEELSQQGVFEIAIGGGEPVKHPEFANILAAASIRGIVPNFTCFGVGWLKDETLVRNVRMFAGGIGVSVHKKSDLKKVKLIQEAVGGHCMVMGQHVIGTQPFAETYDLLKGLDRALILGYKTVGFGDRFQPHKFHDEQVRMLLNKTAKRVSVDTAFLDSYKKCVDAPERFHSSPEGKFSCYIDGVSRKIGPSSYCPPKEMKDLSDVKQIQPLYKEF